MNKIRESFYSAIPKVLEAVLGLAVLTAIAYFGAKGATGFVAMDWSVSGTFYEFISFILSLLLGLELFRLVFVHSIKVIMELMLLIVSRKMLYPGLDSLELLWCVLAFCLIVGMYYFYSLKPIKDLDDLTK